jgi:hypothetical protein
MSLLNQNVLTGIHLRNCGVLDSGYSTIPSRSNAR